MSSYSGANYDRAVQQGQIVNAQLVSPMEPRVKVGNKIVDGKKRDVVAYAYQSAVAGINRGYYTISHLQLLQVHYLQVLTHINLHYCQEQ